MRAFAPPLHFHTFGNKKHTGGEGGIRTHGTFPRTHAFQACTLNHSVTSPCAALYPACRGGSKKLLGAPSIHSNQQTNCFQFFGPDTMHLLQFFNGAERLALAIIVNFFGSFRANSGKGL